MHTGAPIPPNPTEEFETVEFTPTTSGTFEYYCSVPGHRESGQFGTLKVE